MSQRILIWNTFLNEAIGLTRRSKTHVDLPKTNREGKNLISKRISSAIELVTQKKRFEKLSKRFLAVNLLLKNLFLMTILANTAIIKP
jgi:hypothetical protein